MLAVRDAHLDDLDAVVDLAGERRVAYGRVEPRMWKAAHNDRDIHRAFLSSLIDSPDVITVVSAENTLCGFLIATLVSAPPVYDPGGLTAMIDDFVVANGRWHDVGPVLLDAMRQRAAARGATQAIVVSGAHDDEKREALRLAGLRDVSVWSLLDL